MRRTENSTTECLLVSFTDVLYITDNEQIQPEVSKLLEQKKLSCLMIRPEQFRQIDHYLNLIGTAIFDVYENEVSKPHKLTQIIEHLEQNSIGVILFYNPSESLVKGASGNGEGAAANEQTASIDTDELWMRISMNLAYRKKSPNMVVKPATPPKENITTCSNRPSDQLSVTEALVGNLAEQLRLAGLVQRDFLPSQLPNTDYIRWATVFSPAEWVSGDIYDIARLDEKYIGFYIADAVGHSMPAALLTMFLKQALQMRQTLGNEYWIYPPQDVIRNLNVKMADQKLSGYQFATCCYCLINTKTLEMTYARAGHPYPILIRGDEPPTQLEIRGSLLGIFEQTTYKQQSIKLRSGDKLILYSDGADPFVGAFDDKKGFVYTDEFMDLSKLGINDMFEGFNDLAKQHQTDPSDIDDITIVGLEIS